MTFITITNFLLFISFCFTVNGYKIIWDNSATDIDFNNIDSNSLLGRIEEIRLPNWVFIYPGTKWCGAGNIAENEDDLGTAKETDKCCRDHDHCPDIIGGHQTKHNLTNPNFYTRLNCDCDQKFYNCLKILNDDLSKLEDSIVSKQIGNIYFTALGTQCFKEEYPVEGCLKFTYFPKKKCVLYGLDITKEKEYQWFDVPNF